ncbi:hypothetical protein M413DRAFT_29451 [Hebeloma cylindrosporum]|uniref:Uncharacterized protein n=1 Tax=Hebeloma cylindrosporum TaxID=76867 RepID=A0A0C3C4U2_HEBCY|nr:hypothetical protein M413DRAFT_29451 [Hebeloma cylindrosporum h7]
MGESIKRLSLRGQPISIAKALSLPLVPYASHPLTPEPTPVNAQANRAAGPSRLPLPLLQHPAPLHFLAAPPSPPRQAPGSLAIPAPVTVPPSRM